MDREIPVINRVVDKKMQQFRSRKHRQTLSQIKEKSSNMFNSTTYQQTPKINRYSSSFIENKNLQIERQNIKLFNRIASIIRQKPKLPSPSCSYAQSYEQASVRHKKRSDRIKTENESKSQNIAVYEKRILQQKPTIQNKQFFKDRMKNLKYLKLIGRYPYESCKRNSQQCSLNQNQNTNRSASESQLPIDVQIYRKRTDQFFVRITKISSNYYVFNVEVQGSQRNYQYTMNKKVYEEQFMRCGYNYDKMIGQLRLNDKDEVIFKYLPVNQNEEAA